MAPASSGDVGVARPSGDGGDGPPARHRCPQSGASSAYPPRPPSWLWCGSDLPLPASASPPRRRQHQRMVRGTAGREVTVGSGQTHTPAVPATLQQPPRRPPLLPPPLPLPLPLCCSWHRGRDAVRLTPLHPPLHAVGRPCRWQSRWGEGVDDAGCGTASTGTAAGHVFCRHDRRRLRRGRVGDDRPCGHHRSWRWRCDCRCVMARSLSSAPRPPATPRCFAAGPMGERGRMGGDVRCHRHGCLRRGPRLATGGGGSRVVADGAGPRGGVTAAHTATTAATVTTHAACSTAAVATCIAAVVAAATDNVTGGTHLGALQRRQRAGVCNTVHAAVRSEEGRPSRSTTAW